MSRKDDVIDLSKDILEEYKVKKELKAETGRDGIPLVRTQLGGVIVDEEHNTELDKARFQSTPQILFNYKGPSSQPMD